MYTFIKSILFFNTQQFKKIIQYLVTKYHNFLSNSIILTKSKLNFIFMINDLLKSET